MNLQFLGTKDVVTGGEIFRISSLLFYLTLLLDVAMAGYAQHLHLSPFSIAALVLLGGLFALSGLRYLAFHSLKPVSGGAIIELLASVVVVVTLTLQHAMPTPPLPWLIALAGIFPLVIESGFALGGVLLIAWIGLGLNLDLGVPMSDWLPHTFATIFLGLLAILLSQALNVNIGAVWHARTNERRFDAISRATRHVFLISDASYRLKFSNPALHEVLGLTHEELAADGAVLRIHADDVIEHQKKLRYLRDNERSQIFSRHRVQHKNGQWVWMETSGFNMLHDPAIGGLVFSLEDVSARTDIEHKLEEEHALLRTVLDLNPSLIYAKDLRGCFTISNLSFQRRFGYVSEDELRGKTSYDVFLARAESGKELHAYEVADAIHMQDMRVVETGVPQEGMELQGLTDADSKRWYRTNKYPLRDALGNVTGILGITRDITERKQYEMRLEYQALHDPLTGLPNRRYLLTRISEAMAHSGKKAVGIRHGMAMLFCDLDSFKSINDTHGHDFGDQCLTELTERLTGCLEESDFMARFGGNEFIVLTYGGLEQAKLKAEAVLAAISRPLLVDDTVIKLQASIGIAELQDSHRSPSELIRDADAAMFQAKERGRNRAEVYDASLQATATKRAHMDVALRLALERNELTLAYQPKVSLIDGSVLGFELLLRWNSPEYGEISPEEFIPVAETSGMVVPIGAWVLEEACKQLALWQMQYPVAQHLTIAVNVSMRQLLQSSFLGDVKRIIGETGVLPQSVELEITETSAMANPLQTIENLALLKQQGLRLALDDFGTGYSSLSYLQKLPVDVLKIDKSFVRGIGSHPGTRQEDNEIVRLILALAQTLNLETIAEGVETPEQIAELKKLGCFVGQGFIFSPPVSTEVAEALIRNAPKYLMGDLKRVEKLQSVA
jgi:diguanylate cyclase (GGDEF)-like protein/PAS domain S-box-containing protein